ncbi:MAG: S-layer homology domain-containing protein, partial [Oscillibacter sp.]|nr:S-layer homology domain-containing protein [Oscillibacter sp.]
HDINVTNIATKQERLRMNLRITACNGFQIYNVLADGFFDATADFGGKVSRNTVQIGNSAKGYIIDGGRAMKAGEIHDIYVRNVTGCTPFPIATFHSEVYPEHWAYEYDTCRNLYSGKSSSSLICYGDQLSNNLLVPQNCNHEFTRKLTGDNHLWGLPAEAANFEWYACAKCNAVKRPDGVTELIAKANGEDLSEVEEFTPVVTTARFTDVAADSPFKEAIEWAADRKITLGKTATTFEPNTVCTIANIITFIWRANGSPEPELLALDAPFSDVEEGAYYYKAALWAYENGIVNGMKFHPNDPCTRAMTVTYLWYLALRPKASETTPFTDVSETAEYAKAVSWALEQGITTGVTETTFVPDATCTRGQIATFLYRALDK